MIGYQLSTINFIIDTSLSLINFATCEKKRTINMNLQELVKDN